ncbi:MAG: caspase family protein [Bacteroidota bacterium]
MRYSLFLSSFFFLLQIHLLGQKPELVVPTGHSRDLTALDISPDGRFVLTGSTDGKAILWDRKSGNEIKSFGADLQEWVLNLDAIFVPDGNSILVRTNREVVEWDIESGEQLKRFDADGTMAISPDLRYLVTDVDSNAIVWDFQTGEKLHSFSGHTGRIFGVAISPDSRQFLTVSEDSTGIIWDLTSKTERFRTKSTRGMYLSGAFSPDGKHIVMNCIYSIDLWSSADGSLIKTYPGPHQRVGSSTFAFTPDGKYLLASVYHSVGDVIAKINLETHVLNYLTTGEQVSISSDGKYFLTDYKDIALLFELESHRFVQTFSGHSRIPRSTRFSPDGRYLVNVLRKDSTARIWDMVNGTASLQLPAQLPSETNGTTQSVAFSPDGQYIAFVEEEQTVKLWDLANHSEIKTFSGHDSAITTLAFTHDSKTLLTGSKDHTAIYWNIETGAADFYQQFSGAVTSAAFSLDGAYSIFGAGGKVKWFMLQKEKGRTWELDQYNRSEITSSFSPDGKHLFAGSRDRGDNWVHAPIYAAVLDPETGGIKGKVITENSDRWNAFDFSPDGKYVIIGQGLGPTQLWELASGEKVHEFPENSAQSVAFSPDGQYVVISNWHNELKLYEVSSRKELATMILLDTADWVITTPSGLFDASPGAMHRMHYTYGLEVIELEQLKERYYEPGLLAKLTGFQEGEIRDVTIFDDVKLYPETKASIQQDRLIISLTARNGGIGKVSVFVNNKEAMENANPSHKTELSIDLKENVFAKNYIAGNNKISIRSYNAEGWFKSAEIVLEYLPDFVSTKGSGNGSAGLVLAANPSLYTISIGTADYEGDKLDLQFAGKDAIAISTALESAGSQIFQDRVHSYLLSTESGMTAPSKSNIRGIFEEIKAKAEPQDIILLYLSGHGVTYGQAEKANFYYLTKGIASEDLEDPEIRNQFAISDDELTQWLTDIRALKQVMIIDACNSGKVVENLLTGKKQLNSTQIRALDRMKDRTGMFVLSGSASDKVSYEASQYGQGLLTYSILSGMKGRALGGNGQVDIMKLFQFSREEVPQLAKSVKGIQTPMLAFPDGGSSFDIGLVNSSVKIPLAEIKPVFVRNNFQDEHAFADVLKLSEKFSQHLTNITAKGAGAKLIYVDAFSYDENSYSIKGRYTQSEGTVTVSAGLFKGDANIALLTVSGEKSDLDGLVKKIMREAYKHL